MNPIDTLLEFFRQNLLQTLFVLFIGVLALRRALQQASEDRARREKGAMPRPGSDDELREQVRRGFEEMMKQRTAAAAARTAAKAPVKPAPRPAPRPAPKVPIRPEPAAAPRAARAAAPAGGHPFAADAALAQAAARITSLSKEKRMVRRSVATGPSIARRLLLDRDSARRAFLLHEILDEPRSLNSGR